VLDYEYDRNSALAARNRFVQMLRKLKTEYGIEKIHVLAHSMGNFVALDSLATEARTSDPLSIAEIIMAAPDVDRDHFLEIIPFVQKIAGGMTLYASSADKALLLSKSVAGRIPRAGDVSSDGPIILPGIDTIDVTDLGNEMFGLNHDVFAASPTVIADIKALLASSLRPPDQRTNPMARLSPAPVGVTPSTHWRYVPLQPATPAAAPLNRP
jgi:esterase/lipase superfamily enzyme